MLPLLLLGCTPAVPSTPPSLSPQSTGITGLVTGAASGAHVYAYRSASSGLRGPADFEATVQADGSYYLDLAPGQYHLVARGRRQGGDSGPLRAGDRWALYPANPANVGEGGLLRIDFQLQEVVPLRQLRDTGPVTTASGYTGKLVDAGGRTVAGGYVLAYRPGGRRQPDFSVAAGADGRFTLYVSAPGSYCLIARSQLRGQPLPGELLGQFGKGELGCRSVQADELLDIGAIVLQPYQP